MVPLPRNFFRFAACVVFVAVARAQSLLPPGRVPLDSLGAFRPVGANWQLAGGLAGDPRHDKILAATPGTGVLVCNATAAARDQLLTTWEHGDLELDVDFLMTPGADSGLYFQGRYEVQMRDSWGKKEMTFSDNGAIYQSWDETKPAGSQGTGGHAPKANASRAPGLWQHYHVEFEAPRFDASGKKTKNARFAKVVLNGFTVQENAEVTGPTRGAMFKDEAALGPLMIQGNNLTPGHAVRNLAVKRRDAAAKIAVENLSYKLYAGEPKAIGDYDAGKPTLEGSLEKFSQAAVEKSGKFALVFNGSLVVPHAGNYAFTTEASGPVRLLVDAQPVIVASDRGSGDPSVIALTAGRHAFRVDFLQTGNGRPFLALTAESLAIASQLLTTDEARGGFGGGRGRRSLAVEVKDRVLALRSFVPFEPKKRLYAINVGTPAGVHFTYDFETGALLRAWRGAFLDTFEMWDGRGENQIAKPTGPALAFNAKPSVALVEFPLTGGWPEQADAMQSSRGYELEADGLPVFLSNLSTITMRDRIAPGTDGRGLARTLTVGGKLTDWSTWVLLAEADTITPQPGGGGWIVGDREWYLDWPADAAHTPVVHTRGGKQQLVIRVSKAALDAPINYSLVW